MSPGSASGNNGIQYVDDMFSFLLYWIENMWVVFNVWPSGIVYDQLTLLICNTWIPWKIYFQCLAKWSSKEIMHGFILFCWKLLHFITHLCCHFCTLKPKEYYLHDRHSILRNPSSVSFGQVLSLDLHEKRVEADGTF
jgi:hypothetical protein